MAEKDIIRQGDDRWERLFARWKASKGDAGWLVIGSEQYRVIANDDDSVIFIPVTGNIDSMYGSMSGGI
jgi:hypothetical protein